ncbi:MAG: UDP-N-acetylmuramoyl-L-alanyl-D-glutamate--2,6-diaminopimelate ligase [Oscillospiraceae bacterium]|nr:UDP-N-acetylmuramoyl-L-alanyl-D-glutamate--2,6-diaminopimelate ligase [Oscillospiraceae bacterium]
MKLYEISREAQAAGIADAEISGVTDNSHEFKSGDVFVCIKGENFDGHKLAREMLEKGAAAVVTETDLKLQNQITVPNSRKYYATLASAFYGNPTEKLKIVAATGTNGKSTVIALIKHIIEKQGHKCGSIGTVCYDTAGKIYEAKLTVPRQMELYRLFRETVDNGAKYCVVEASSQALSQDRFADEIFDCAVFTNLTQDHLDWHKTMEKYFLSKRSLFDMAKSAAVCIDDKYGKKLIKYIESKRKMPLMTYSAKDFADNYAVNIKSGSAGVSYWLSSMKEEKSFPVKLSLPGLYNVANSIAAVSACTLLGIKIDDAVEALCDFKGVKGRCEVIYDGEFTVICDYAHTPDALVKFLSEVQDFAPKKDGIRLRERVICVFGAPGERDVKKRPLMGAAADKYSDYIFVTSDNPRFEEPVTIIKDVCKGIKNTPYETFTEREDAITAAVKTAGKGDIIVLCGKGHESYQVIGDQHIPFDEREITLKAIETLKQGQ